MGSRLETLEAQLSRWGVQIDHLAARTQTAGVGAGFELHMYIDELKALHAIVRGKLDEYRAEVGTERKRLWTAVDVAWKELELALDRPMP